MQPKPTSLEVLIMEVGTVTVALEDKQTPGSGDANKQPNPSQSPDQKAKDAKAAPERKRTRNLSEDRRFKLFSGTANRPLSEEIGRHIGVPVGEVKLQR